MRALHAYNSHRGFGGSDRATAATIGALRRGGVEVEEFVRDSRELPPGLAGKVRAFAGGLYAAEAVRDFTKVIAERRPDVVHVHELYPLISPWILPVCARAGLPVVMSCYDFRLSCPVATHHSHGAACFRCVGGREHWCVIRNCRSNLPESIAYALRNASARRFGLYTRNVGRFVAISAYQRDFLATRAGLVDARVVVNPCVVEIPPQPVADPSQGGYVAYAGRFVHEKGVEVMVQACRREGLPMAFAGDAPAHPAVQPQDGARFVITRSRSELNEFYRGARMVVVPSLWEETFGLVAAEAMSHGIPVVASRIGALPETVRDGETGLLAEPGDVADLAAKIRRIWDDAGLARDLGQRARRQVEAEYGEGPHVERLAGFYRDAIAAMRPDHP
jgi:glycosyltransferase involved in cell wall biosynthesis